MREQKGHSVPATVQFNDAVADGSFTKTLRAAGGVTFANTVALPISDIVQPSSSDNKSAVGVGVGVGVSAGILLIAAAVAVIRRRRRAAAITSNFIERAPLINDADY